MMNRQDLNRAAAVAIDDPVIAMDNLPDVLPIHFRNRSSGMRKQLQGGNSLHDSLSKHAGIMVGISSDVLTDGFQIINGLRSPYQPSHRRSRCFASSCERVRPSSTCLIPFSILWRSNSFSIASSMFASSGKSRMSFAIFTFSDVDCMHSPWLSVGMNGETRDSPDSTRPHLRPVHAAREPGRDGDALLLCRWVRRSRGLRRLRSPSSRPRGSRIPRRRTALPGAGETGSARAGRRAGTASHHPATPSGGGWSPRPSARSRRPSVRAPRLRSRPEPRPATPRPRRRR